LLLEIERHMEQAKKENIGTACLDVKRKPLVSGPSAPSYDVKEKTTDTIWCTSCEEAQAIGMCQDCQLDLCEEELRVHKKAIKTRHHSILSVSELSHSALSSRSGSGRGRSGGCLKCEKPSHEGEPLKLYCQTCEKLVCIYCVYHDHPRPDHNTFLIAEAKQMTDRFKSEMTKDLDHMKTIYTQMKQSLAQVVELENKLNESVDTTMKMVKEKFGHLMKCLEERQNSLLCELQQIKTTKLTDLSVHKQNLELMIGKVDSIFRDCETGIEDDIDLLALRSTIKNQFKQVNRMQTNTNQQPKEDVWIDGKMDGCDDLQNRIGHFGTIISQSVSVKHCVIDPAKQVHQNDNPDSQYRTAILYHYGRGVEQDYQKAMEWYMKAANQNHAAAQFNIGWLYRNGQGVAQDYQKAMEWYMKAANQNHAAAQNNIGWLYENGQGVAQDYQKAMEWYMKAANQNHGCAQEKMRELERAGKVRSQINK
jgi:tetratricopeptide (TPR) repeat protein